jgi:glycosyltransferase involved in cell wall biosynthesis
VKKVYHLITTILRGGAENQLLVVVKEQVMQGLEVHIVYLKGAAELEQELISAGASVHHELVGKTPLFQPWHMMRLVAGERIILHAHLPRAELVGLATIGNFQFIATRHNAESFFPGVPEFLSRFLSRLVEYRADKIIAISDSVKKFLLNSGEVKNEENIEIVYYGYFPEVDAKQLKSNLQFNLLRLGTISRLAPQKDLPTMIRAFHSYNIQNPNSTLSILGAGPLESELNHFVETLNLKSKVEFLGRSSFTRDFLLSLDVFVLTSLYEGFGMVLFEAMDAGIPIVASRNSAIPEVLGEDFPGLCTTGDSDDFLHKINALKEPKYRSLVLDIQEERLRMFSANSMSEKLITLYEN